MGGHSIGAIFFDERSHNLNNRILIDEASRWSFHKLKETCYVRLSLCVRVLFCTIFCAILFAALSAVRYCNQSLNLSGLNRLFVCSNSLLWLNGVASVIGNISQQSAKTRFHFCISNDFCLLCRMFFARVTWSFGICRRRFTYCYEYLWCLPVRL